MGFGQYRPRDKSPITNGTGDGWGGMPLLITDNTIHSGGATGDPELLGQYDIPAYSINKDGTLMRLSFGFVWTTNGATPQITLTVRRNAAPPTTGGLITAATVPCYNSAGAESHVFGSTNIMVFQSNGSVGNIIPVGGTVSYVAALADETDLKATMKQTSATDILLSVPLTVACSLYLALQFSGAPSINNTFVSLSSSLEIVRP